MNNISDSFIPSVPFEEKKRRLAEVYALILSLPDQNKIKDSLEVDTMDGIRFEEEQDQQLKSRNIQINKITGPNADDDLDRHRARVSPPKLLTNYKPHSRERGENI
jgi:hypothetical protein